MAAFRGHIFEQDEVRESNQEVLRERPLLIGILLLLVAALLIVIGWTTLGIIVMLVGGVIQLLARFSIFTPISNKISGNMKEIKIDSEGITIDQSFLSFDSIDYGSINLFYYEDQIASDYQQNWKATGRENRLNLTLKGQSYKYDLWLRSYAQVKQLEELELPSNFTIKGKII